MARADGLSSGRDAAGQRTAVIRAGPGRGHDRVVRCRPGASRRRGADIVTEVRQGGDGVDRQAVAAARAGRRPGRHVGDVDRPGASCVCEARFTWAPRISGSTSTTVWLPVSASIPPSTPERNASALPTGLSSGVEHLPGVSSVSVASLVPLGGDSLLRSFHPAGRTDIPGSRPSTYSVGPRYFQSLAIPFLRGRDFDASHVAGTPAVAIVNETFAKTHFPGQDVLGQTSADRR